MSRILLATIGSLGDLHPLIAIGLELRRRGHEVGFCTSETYRGRLEELGFRFDPLRPDLTPEKESAAHLVKEIMDPRRGAERLVRGLMMPELAATYSDLLRAVTGPPPVDLLVSGELVYAAPLVAEKTGIRWASCITAPMSFFSAYDLPVLPPFPRLAPVFRWLGPRAARLALQVVKFVTRNWGQPVQELRSALGLPAGLDPIYEGKFSPQLVLGIFSTVLGVPQPDWPPNTLISGFPFYDGAEETGALPVELKQFLENGEAPIVFTLGSSAVMDPGQFYFESAKAARLLKRRAVLLMGRNPLSFPLPPGVVAFGYVGFSELFPRATAVVHQGGVGTTGQALRAGCPVLVMPYAFDQPDNAARLVRLGVGRRIARNRYSAGRAAEELKLLLQDPLYRRKATELREAVEKESGATTAAAALERLLQQ